uniref:Uncharacterized protein n=1 Tax=Anguilla anguilla TaxID=7936 RepID=A0A0E9WZR2_ANGAN
MKKAHSEPAPPAFDTLWRPINPSRMSFCGQHLPIKCSCHLLFYSILDYTDICLYIQELSPLSVQLFKANFHSNMLKKQLRVTHSCVLICA